MLTIIAVAVCFFLIIKILFFLIYPTTFLDGTPTITDRVRKYSTIIQSIVIVLMLIAFFFLCTQLDIFTIMATGVFWIFMFIGAYFPFVTRAIEYNELLRKIQHDSRYVSELRILHFPVLVICVITIAIAIFS